MNKWFDEKADQLSVDQMTAFGIPISSRYAKASETVEMIKFCNKAASLNLEHHINEIFYDSKAQLCDLQISDSLIEGSDDESTLLEFAKQTISQFLWFDSVHHGAGLRE